MKVDAVAFSPDGFLLASASADSTVKLWEAGTGRELRTLQGHAGGAKALAFSADGRWLASGGNDKTVRIWDVASGRELRALAGHAGPVESVAFSPDGRWLVSGSADNAAKLWDAATGAEVRTLSGHTGWVTAAAFSQDGRWLATGGADNSIKLWEVATGQAKRTLKGHTGRVRSVAFSPDGQWLASGGGDAKTKLWKVSGGREKSSLDAGTGGVLAVAFSADGGRVVSGSGDKTVKVWDAATGRELSTTAPADASEAVVSMAISPDGRRSAYGSGGRTIALLDLTSGKELLTFESHTPPLYAVAFSGDGRWLASGANDRSVKLWDVTTGRQVSSLTGHAGWVTSIAFSADGNTVAAGSLSGEARIWETATGRQLHALRAHTESTNAVTFLNSGKWLATASNDATVKLWDVATGRELRTLKGHSGEVTALAVSRDGRWLATAGVDKTIKLWDVPAGTAAPSLTLENSAGGLYAIAFSGDGRWLASGGNDKTVGLWEVATGRRTLALAGHSGEIRQVAFSSDGKWLASAAADQTVRLWDAVTGKAGPTLSGHSGGVNGVSFSKDSSWIISAGEDGSSLVWNARTGAPAATLVSIRGSGDWLVVTPDGLFDGAPRAWDQILWRFSGQTTNTAPVEAFFNEFYHPGLLADVLGGKAPTASQNISRKDRRQPKLKLALDGAAPAAQEGGESRHVNVRIEVVEASAGARDVRLFRNGSLVKLWRGDVRLGADGKAALETSIPIVAGENNFSAYAFNRDNIKSGDAELTINGAESLRRAGALYVLAVGVNEYANPEFNLKYAVPDAEVFGDELRRQQDLLRAYARTEVISLYNEQAKKKSILDALSTLSQKMRPEDAVVIYFAGHGTVGTCRTESSTEVNAKDRFYLVPHDLGYAGQIPEQCDQGMLSQVTSHSISDEELEGALEGVDAGQILLVIDACNSGQALESEEKRRGPMNSKGLAQLAYEKGMYILTAAQSFQEAKADKKIAKGHGYLTYALVEEGLKMFSADDQPKDDRVVLREWLDYAARRVPLMQQAEAQERRQLVKRSAVKTVDESDVQQPRVFYRGDGGPKPFIVAARGRISFSAPKSSQ